MLKVVGNLVVTGILLGAVAVAMPTQIQAAEDKTARPSQAESREPELVLQGKLFCSVKRQVPMPFKGVVTSVGASAGQKVKAGEVLAGYRLASDVVMQLRRRLCPPQISELEGRSAEIDTRLTGLKSKQTELSRLLTHDMAPEESLKQVKREMQVLERQRALLQDRIGLERKMLADDLVLVKELLSETVSPAHIPESASLVSPIDGYVIGIHPELREGAEIGPVAPAFLIGVMDPMIMRAQIHEMEAFRLSLGDKAEITVESLPGRRFVAQVSRTSWTPLTPALEQPSYYEIELTVPNPDIELKDGLKGEILVPKSR
jgi:multidrug efflux pump subunit AcrA (membrane-fusion protein)